MCDSPRDSRASGAFERGRHEIRTGRRTLLTAGAAGIAISTATSGLPRAAAAASAGTRRRAYVLVLDGCRPDEISPTLMPRTSALRDGGLHHPRATSLPVMETIPSHVMMMSGVRPDRSGVPANSILDRTTGEVRDMDRPEDIRVRTIIERLNRNGLTTGTVLSKEYLYGIFGGRATHRWEPAPIVPVSGHAPDASTMEATLAMVEEHDPHLVFVNLGDIDRMGHSDLTGPLGVRAARQAALAATDLQVGRFVDLLKSSGRWQTSLLVVLADHSMDWSLPHQLIHLTPVLEADPLLAGHVTIADNGGADLLYWTGDPALLDAAVTRMRALTSAVPGVLAAHDPRVTPALRTGPLGGDVIVYARAGWRFSDPDQWSNPIPGNHGHPATMPIPFFLAGGHRRVPRGVTSSRRAATIDVAPTLADFFGVGAPRGGYDGRSRLP
ncbi:alkaline phosphatase family protein [Nocardioides ganghwensis]|uniref:Alkaline phosphatase family protein n=1 Tax=Nocardioides ganghwensis TaxID=252230 RepID=A0A4Q2SAN8_9ACTN|nr:alkaline phosphatase family protein [Nocardioides ganghwensis]MBD3944028.1 alkaline phosphatase family protein [Nocardioides ganghwensis]RYC01539.1 alkaline phosphatase family protein [Nocardioides ganghwensis]